MNCVTWMASGKDRDARARNVQLSLGVNPTDAVEIRDTIDAYCYGTGSVVTSVFK
jgi:hypothetical protein